MPSFICLEAVHACGICRAGVGVVPADCECVVVAVGFFDDEQRVVVPECEAVEGGCQVVKIVGAEGAGGVFGLRADVSFAKEFDGEAVKRFFGGFPEGSVEFVTGWGVINA